MNPEIARTIIDYFNIPGEVLQITAFGTGHIHDTFLIKTARNKYVLQKINHYVFRNIPELMSNIVRVTGHLNSKLEKAHALRALNLVPTRNNKPFFTNIKNDFWRVYDFIDETSVFELPPDTDYAYEGGKAFGTFISEMADFPDPRLYETIPDFHNMQYRLEEFNSKKEINFIREHAQPLKRIYDLYLQGSIPERITHNDTKFNNILFSKKGKAVSIIDLDTVMPGCIHFDFGDAVRIIGSTAAEDEPDLEKIIFNMEMFRAFTRGFLFPLAPLLSKKEMETLALAPLYMTFITGLRFLTDYLRGDVYYKTDYPQHNWYRACAQFQLFRRMMASAETMRQIIYDCVGRKKFKG